jgi:dipeptidyl aminopeptidase/acylaminoacyl peptidase
MKQTFLLIFSLFITISLMAQESQLRQLDHPDFLIWKTIQDKQIAADGGFVAYRLVPGEGDPQLNIYDAATKTTRQIARVSKSNIDYDGKFIFGLITPYRDSLRNLERKKIEKKEWPCDTFFITSGNTNELVRIPNVTEYKFPAKKGDWVAYSLKDAAMQVDTSKEKKKSKKEIVHLIVRQLSTGREDTLMNVKEYTWAEKAPVLLAVTASRDSSETAGVAFWSDHEWRFVKKQKGEYAKLSLAPDGNQVAFLGNLDTTKAQVQPWQLFYYDFKTDSAQSIAAQNKSTLPLLSQHTEPRWSDDGKYLFYGRASMPLIKDTTLLADEIVDVEIWSTDDPELYTSQNVNKAKEEKRSYAYVYDTQLRQHIPICSPTWESAVYAPERNSRFVLVYTEKPYLKESTWLGDARKDLAKVDLLTGAVIPIRKGMLTNPRISPGSKYAYGYSEVDSTWWTYQFTTGTFSFMKRAGYPSFYNELNDVPNYPNSYGQAGWVKDDQSLIVYDRYDLWAWSGESAKAPVPLTKGRDARRVHRYIKTDPEEKYLSPNQPWLIHVKDDVDKSSGYTWFNPAGFILDTTYSLSAYEHARQVTKARLADTYMYTKENFTVFPDIQLTSDRFVTNEKISDANPQQKDYLWGSIRLYRWMDWDSTMRTGLLVLPPGYDTLRSYPTIVNFYERSSDELHNHTAPAPHRSTINYAFYASRGYVIFNPDISYKIGLPGESAYQIVMSGVTSLVKDRIADGENLALQGHSWGGYQIAYILTRTNMFKCAEAGAAVVNMTSAYGGIRWETGIARNFQYEHEQSRLGKTLWQDPNLYITNSPLFKINKIETPLLLLHNNEDGAVPFEQGIEFYLALRRLEKTAWLLNYRGEPHWPVKWENRKDFNIRMSQFFDHYLKGAPMPLWMEKGVTAVERGMNRGY